ncbi:MAG: 50S ribosomal protein L25 [bacterium]|nr:50S ribosomal protein L25 [bacterium]
MEVFQFEVKARAQKGTNASRRIRKQAIIPGVLYGSGNSLPLELDLKEFKKIAKKVHGGHAIINLAIKKQDGEIEKTTLLKDIQYDIVSDSIIHVDFQEISLDKELVTTVPIELVGIPAGVKEGGVLEQVIRNLEIRALPLKVPGKFTLDVSGLTIGHSITVSNITPIEGVTILTSKDKTAATLLAPSKEEVKAATEVEAAAAAAKAEPEVIGKKEKEGEEKEGEEKEAGKKDAGKKEDKKKEEKKK